MRYKPGVYRHFKGNKYRLLCVAKHSETLEEMVVYQALSAGMGVWVRPLRMWGEMVEHEGQLLPRFHYIGEEDQQPGKEST